MHACCYEAFISLLYLDQDTRCGAARCSAAHRRVDEGSQSSGPWQIKALRRGQLGLSRCAKPLTHSLYYIKFLHTHHTQ